MKYIAVVCVIFCLAEAKVLPEYLSNLVCKKSDPDFSRCMVENLAKARLYMLKGIPEFNFPPLDPFTLPYMSVDRTINDLVSIKAVMKNIRVVGANNTILELVKGDPEDHSGELRMTMPWLNLEMEYAVTGQLLTIPLSSQGFFSGNFTDTQLYAKGKLKIVKKKGVEYFRVEKMNVKIRSGDGHIKLIAADPELQFGADLIANFFNEDPQRVMDAVNPIFAETTTDLYTAVINQGLAKVPARELLPE